MAEKTTIIQFDQVSLAYGEDEILENFSLEIEKGEFLTVIGSSGCGKTTMLKLINGLLKPQTGTISVNKKNIRDVDRITLRRGIGYVVQDIGLFPHMTIEKNITYVPCLEKGGRKKNMNREVEAIMEALSLPMALKNRYPGELSGGQKQRVGIARALISKPEIVLMDEPFGAVDEITRKKLQQEITDIHRELGVTIVFVTHDIREALTLGTKVLVMNGGNIAQFDQPKQVKQKPASEFVKMLVSGQE